jgi:ribosome biogenesis protein MAK21
MKQKEIQDRLYTAAYGSMLLCLRSQTASSTTSSRFFPLFLNLIHRVVATDTSTARLQAFLKRWLQCAAVLPFPNVACTCLWLASREFARRVGVRGPRDEKFDEASENPLPEADARSLTSCILLNCEGQSDGSENVVNGVDAAASRGSLLKSDASSATVYSLLKRNPRFAGAEHSSLWELCLLSNHFHPTIRKWAAEGLLKLSLKEGRIRPGKGSQGLSMIMNFMGEPMRDFTGLHFLEKFCLSHVPTRAKGRIPVSVDVVRWRLLRCMALRLVVDRPAELTMPVTVLLF